MNRIEEQARYYRNIPLRNRSIKAVVHLEDAEDMLFWNLQQPENMANEHLDDANAYLHIQGHQLYKLVLHIGATLCKGTRVAFKTDILDKSIHTDGYLEIDSVQADLRKITSKE